MINHSHLLCAAVQSKKYTCSHYSVIFPLGEDYNSLPFRVHLWQGLCLPGYLFNVFSLLIVREKILVASTAEKWKIRSLLADQRFIFLGQDIKQTLLFVERDFLKGRIFKGLCCIMRPLSLIVEVILEQYQFLYFKP